MPEVDKEKLPESEMIGRIKLDLTKYSGTDPARDRAVEERMLKIARDLSPVEFQRAIEEDPQWQLLYNLSAQRENVVDWIPMEPGSKVLEIGSGCGAITGALARRAGEVTCVEPSRRKSTINAYRLANQENVTIHVGPIPEVVANLPKDYDYIFLIGYFEVDLLRILLKHLKKSGRLIIATENKYGLKYFAGCQEEHTGDYFSGIENYARSTGTRTYGRKGLERIFAECGVKESHFYYPYPDYNFCTTLYSDRKLPAIGELSNNMRNFDRDRVVLFNELSAYDGIIEEGLYPTFANSYLIILGKDFPVDYVKYSNDRAYEYAIRTQIGRNSSGDRVVEKYPQTPLAMEHVKSMFTAFKGLKHRYEDSELHINVCELDEETGKATFQFLEGRPLSELMDECLAKGDQKGFMELFRKYYRLIDHNSQLPVADYDLIFANIMVNGDQWSLIDYEWTFGKQIDTREVAFRAVYCYVLENEAREKLDLDEVLKELKITEAEAEDFRAQEQDFQRFVTGKHLSMGELRNLIGGRIMTPMKWLDNYKDLELINRFQVYEDTGAGFSEERSYFVEDAYQGEDHIECTLTIPGNVKTLRLDPAMCSCMVKINYIRFNGVEIPYDKKTVYSNGRMTNESFIKGKDGAPTAIFATEDPNIYIVLGDTGETPAAVEHELEVSMDIVRIPPDMAENMAAAVRKII